MEKLKNTPAAANYLGISRSKLYKLCHYRELKHLKVFGQLRFREADLEKYLQDHLVEIKTKEELEHEVEKLRR